MLPHSCVLSCKAKVGQTTPSQPLVELAATLSSSSKARRQGGSSKHPHRNSWHVLLQMPSHVLSGFNPASLKIEHGHGLQMHRHGTHEHENMHARTCMHARNRKRRNGTSKQVNKHTLAKQHRYATAFSGTFEACVSISTPGTSQAFTKSEPLVCEQATSGPCKLMRPFSVHSWVVALGVHPRHLSYAKADRPLTLLSLKLVVPSQGKPSLGPPPPFSTNLEPRTLRTGRVWRSP